MSDDLGIELDHLVDNPSISDMVIIDQRIKVKNEGAKPSTLGLVR